jgi:hypothetical protein
MDLLKEVYNADNNQYKNVKKETKLLERISLLENTKVVAK